MPIPIKVLEKARQTPEERILAFLRDPAQQGKAFREWEIVQAVDGVDKANALVIVWAYTLAAGKAPPEVPTLEALRRLAAPGGPLKMQKLDGQNYFYLADRE